MDKLKAIYIEEGGEIISNLEEALLKLDNNPEDSATIQEVFRDMHTLKGNSSMFGYTKISEFLHNFETVYDLVRNKEIELTKELINVSFASLDHLKKLIEDHEIEDEQNKINHNSITETIEAIINPSNSQDKGEQLFIEEKKQATTEQDTVEKTFHIFFSPGKDVLLNGTKPLFLLDELTSFGETFVIPYYKEVENVENFDPLECHISWDILLATEQNKEAILDVFIFVESNSKIEVTEISEGNLFNNQGFIDSISSLPNFKSERIDFSKIETSSLTAITDSKEVKNRVAINNQLKSELKKKSGHKEKVISSIRVASDKLDELMNLVSELVTTQASLSLYSEENKRPELEIITENVEKLSRRLRDIAFGMTLVPLNNMFGRYQRMVRDISAELNKDIAFVTEGGETELDKTIIESLADPVMHILRNSLDHGIESKEDRLIKGKPETGKLLLKAFYSGVYVCIQIIDDGGGIDVEAVREKAISNGLISKDDVLTEKEIYDLIFAPGFSTAEKVTDVSGRGVGMDVVRRNISDLRGTVEIKSVKDEGTTLTIKLPLTLSIIDGLLVKIDDTNYVIPLSVITKCYEVDYEEMTNNFNNLLVLDGEQIAFINLRNEFLINTLPPVKSQMIVVNNGERKVGLSIDSIVGEYQAVIKSVGKYYKNQDFVSGATILGDGTIALVLDTNKIINQFTQIKLMEELV